MLVPALRELGHDVYVLAGETAVDNDPWAVDLRRYWKWRVRERVLYKFYPEAVNFNAASLTLASALRALRHANKIDVLEMEESFGFSLMSSRLNLIPIFVRLHGPWFLNGRFKDPNDDNLLFERREEREGKAIEAAQFVTAPSAEVLQSVKDHYKLRLIRSRVIRNPINAVSESKKWKSRKFKQ